jgi:hypothetical protein
MRILTCQAEGRGFPEYSGSAPQKSFKELRLFLFMNTAHQGNRF